MVKIDQRKVQAILKWTTPIKVVELRSFLGLANYYCKFVASYSKKITLLMDLLKKNQPWT